MPRAPHSPDRVFARRPRPLCERVGPCAEDIDGYSLLSAKRGGCICLERFRSAYVRETPERTRLEVAAVQRRMRRYGVPRNRCSTAPLHTSSSRRIKPARADQGKRIYVFKTSHLDARGRSAGAGLLPIMAGAEAAARGCEAAARSAREVGAEDQPAAKLKVTLADEQIADAKWSSPCPAACSSRRATQSCCPPRS